MGTVLFPFFALLTSIPAFADENPAVPGPPAYPTAPNPGAPGNPPMVPSGRSPLAAQMIYSCPPGPGYLRMTLVNMLGLRFIRQDYLLNPGECRKQLEMLRKLRPVITHHSIVAYCTTHEAYS